VIAIVHGASTAGGAYMPGLSDYVIMVKGRAKAFLAGPPLLKAATGEIANDEELGGAQMHTQVSGLGEYLADDDAQAIGIARNLIQRLGWQGNVHGQANPSARSGWLPPRYPSEELIGIMPADFREPIDMREVIVRLIDDSDFLDFQPDYGPQTLVGHAAIEGYPIGIITNNGPIDTAGSNKATHFIQACCQAQIPLLYLQNTTGYMVGKASEQAGMIKHGSKMIQAVANASVPSITIHCGASFGAGNYGMCGRGFDPRFIFSWPHAKTAVMGAEQAAKTMRIVAEAGAARKGEAVDEEALQMMEQKIIDNFERQAGAFYTSARLLDDGLIDPRDTRQVLSFVLATCREEAARRLQPIQFGVARP
jgi:geranyl-CoA carboxylase beta subunit